MDKHPSDLKEEEEIKSINNKHDEKNVIGKWGIDGEEWEMPEKIELLKNHRIE